MTRIRIILVDDHVIVRQGLRSLISQEKDLQVVGEADDGLQLLDLATQCPADVVVIDLKMPNLNGIDASEEIRRRFPLIHIVILTMHADRSYIERAFQVGVSGYVLKEDGISEICSAIRHAAKGAHYVSKRVSTQIPALPVKGKSLSNNKHVLTLRERQVFQLVAEGKTNSEIAELLGISIRTVEGHRAHFMSKLDLKTHVDFVRYALKHGIFLDE